MRKKSLIYNSQALFKKYVIELYLIFLPFCAKCTAKFVIFILFCIKCTAKYKGSTHVSFSHEFFHLIKLLIFCSLDPTTNSESTNLELIDICMYFTRKKIWTFLQIKVFHCSDSNWRYHEKYQKPTVGSNPGK